MPNWTTPLLNLLPALFIAAFTSWLTVRLSLRRFHAERWWERKADSYSRIVEALIHLMEYCSAMSDESSAGRELPETRRKELSDNFDMAYRDLRKATAIGAYIISDEVAAVLTRLQMRPTRNWQENPPWEIYDDDYKAYHDALGELRRLAKKDLRVS